MFHGGTDEIVSVSGEDRITSHHESAIAYEGVDASVKAILSKNKEGYSLDATKCSLDLMTIDLGR